MDEIIAQFIAVTSSDAESAKQYLEATDFQLEQAVELFYAAGGGGSASAGGTDAFDIPPEDSVRDRIEGFEDQMVDETAMYYNELARDTRRAEVRARKPRGVFNQNRDGDLSDLSRHEKRLANLFRPPFDIITEAGLEEAKEEAQETGKMLMVNVQDLGEFVCQQLNRDLFRNTDIKKVIEKNFIFVQYDVEEPDGEDYRVLYPFTSFPHISIIDPWTGEQQKVWSKVPLQQEFISDIQDYLASKPKDTDHIPPTPKVIDEHDIHEVYDNVLDSNAPPAESGDNDESRGSLGKFTYESMETATSQEPEGESNSVNSTEVSDAHDFFNTLPEIGEEPAGADTTRIQFKYGDGTRSIRRFNLQDSVIMLYAYVKTKLNAEFTLTNGREDLKSEITKSIAEAKLQNSTILVELV